MARMRSVCSVTAFLIAALGCSSSSFQVEANNDTGGDDTNTSDSLLDTGTETAPDVGFVGLELVPVTAITYVDTAVATPVPATLTYKAIKHQKDGGTKDVSSTAKFVLDDPSLGTFTGPTFTSVTKLGGTALAASTIVRATEGSDTAAGLLTLVTLRKTTDKKDFFFVVPYGADPDPTRDVLKFGTNIKQVDVAVLMDCTGSMGGSIANLQTNLSTTLFPKLVAAIPSTGLSVVYHDDYPYGSYGSPGCGATTLPGDLPVGVVQTVTTDLTKAQAAASKLSLHCGSDGPESQIPAMYHVLTGEKLAWPTGSVAAHTPVAGTFGGVDFRPGSLSVVVEITDVDWHGTGHTPYSFTAPDMPELKKAFNDHNAKFVDITNGAWTASEEQANELSDATKSNIATSAFGTSCAVGQCCTGMSGAARAATGPGGSCRLNFLHNNGAGVSDSIVTAIQALAVGSFFDVKAAYSNDPANPDSVDATQFIKALRAMKEGDTANGCGPSPAKDTDADGVDDTFTAVKVGTPVCFEIIPKRNDTVKPKPSAQFFNAFVDVLGMPGAVKLDRRTIVFLVPPKFGT